MIRGGFLNEDQREELEQITRRSIEPHGVARRANAVLLLDDGKSCALIAEFLYLDDDTIRTWYKCYMSGGFDALERFDWKGGKAYLSKIQEAELARLSGPKHGPRHQRGPRLYPPHIWPVFFPFRCHQAIAQAGF